MFIAACGQKRPKPRRGGMFISTIAKTLSKTAKLTPMVRRKTEPTGLGPRGLFFLRLTLMVKSEL